MHLQASQNRFVGWLLTALLVAVILGGQVACSLKSLSPEETPTQPLAVEKPEIAEPDPSQRFCVWLLVATEPGLIAKAGKQKASGQHFVMAARELAKQEPVKLVFNADCQTVANLNPEIVRAIKGLAPGQLSRPFSLPEGEALAMLTTDDHRKQAQNYLDNEKFAEAISELRLDLELNPPHVSSWHLLALSYVAMGQELAAMEAFDKGLALDYRNPLLLNDKAATLMSLGHRQEALPLLRQAHLTEPANPVINGNLAFVLAQEKQDLELAEELASKAVEAMPNNAAFWKILGKVQQARNRHIQAVSSLQKALELDPTSSEVKALLTKIRSDAHTFEAPFRPAVSVAPAGSKNSTASSESPNVPVALVPPDGSKPTKTAPPQPPAKAGSRSSAPTTPRVFTKSAPATRPVPPTTGTNSSSQNTAPPKVLDGYYVQVGIYVNSLEQQVQFQAWQKIGFKLVPWIDAAGVKRQRALMGPYVNQSTAIQAGENLVGRGSIPSYIVVRVGGD